MILKKKIVGVSNVEHYLNECLEMLTIIPLIIIAIKICVTLKIMKLWAIRHYLNAILKLNFSKQSQF